MVGAGGLCEGRVGFAGYRCGGGGDEADAAAARGRERHDTAGRAGGGGRGGSLLGTADRERGGRQAPREAAGRARGLMCLGWAGEAGGRKTSPCELRRRGWAGPQGRPLCPVSAQDRRPGCAVRGPLGVSQRYPEVAPPPPSEKPLPPRRGCPAGPGRWSGAPENKLFVWTWAFKYRAVPEWGHAAGSGVPGLGQRRPAAPPPAALLNRQGLRGVNAKSRSSNTFLLSKKKWETVCEVEGASSEET